MTSIMTSEVERLIVRARERMAEQDAWDARQKAAGYTLGDRYPEFCGAFRELLDMLVTELDDGVPAAIKAAADQGGGVVQIPAGEYGPGWVPVEPHDEGTSYCTSIPGACPVHEPDEAQRIAEVFDDARAELDRGL